MFNNVGKKIMILAKILCWVGMLGGAITGLVFCIVDDGYYIALGLPLLFGSPILFWIGSWWLYSWGELCDNVSDMLYYSYMIANKTDSKDSSTPSKNLPVSVKKSYTGQNVCGQKPVLSFESKNIKIKELLEKGLITQDEYNAMINK